MYTGNYMDSLHTHTYVHDILINIEKLKPYYVHPD